MMSDTSKPCVYETPNRNGKVMMCRVFRAECDDPYACSFRQTKDEQQAGREHAYDRLRTLDDDMQAHISAKYYDGKMPWWGDCQCHN